MTGVREARVICAINKDENAAHIPAVLTMVSWGDLYEVLPY
jgi:electron transfer flavoprotein alpha subunit